jgi:hypothetical protein
MRVKVAANDLKVGQIAYLPFFNDLRRSKIIKIERNTKSNLLRVTYLTNIHGCKTKNMCIFSDPDNKDFLIYKRPK